MISIKKNLSTNTLNTDEINALGKQQLSNSEIIENGIVLTPSPLTDLVLSKCQHHLGKSKLSLAGDFCSGMGAFIGALNRSFPQINTLSFEHNQTLYELSRKYYASSQNQILLLDTLFDTETYSSSFDLLVGNPPYVRVQNIPSETKTKLEANAFYRRFLKGSYDLSVAFLARSIKLLKNGGIAGLILPRKLLFSAYGEQICSYLSSNTQILEIIDFGDNQLFADKTTYISIVIFRKQQTNEPYVFNYYAIPTLKGKTISEMARSVDSYLTICHSSIFKSFPWEFKSQNEKLIMHQIINHSIPLPSVFSITQGFRTGKNKAFLVDAHFPNEPCLHSYVDGTNIKRGFLANRQRIIWPYYFDNTKYTLIPETDFSRLNPHAYNKLHQSLQPVSVASWYGYSRPQNLSIMGQPKIFLKEMMPRAEFAADPDGTICFSSGYALIPAQPMIKEHLSIWAMVLSTNVMEYQYRSIGTNLHSGWFRMYKNHAEKIRLPVLDICHDQVVQKITSELSNDIGNESLWDQLNHYIGKQFGLSEDCLLYINSILSQKHNISMPRKKNGTTTMESQTCNMRKYVDILEETTYHELSIEDRAKYLPVELTCYNILHEDRPEYRTLVTYQNDKKMPIQRWYKYTQGYSTTLVSKILAEFNATSSDLVFDPFCGGGTTLLAAKNVGIPSVGCDVSPLSCWISKIKTHNWTHGNATRIVQALNSLHQGYDYSFEHLAFNNFLSKVFFPDILAQTVHIQNWIATVPLEQIEKDFLNLALVSIQEEISVIRKHGSHYRFLNDETHVGVNKLNIKLIEEDADVVEVFKNKVFIMLDDISMLTYTPASTNTRVFCSDIRSFSDPIPKATIVITSPPYLNRNNYFSQQKIELSLLKLINNSKSYTELVKKSFCSHIEASLPESPVCVVPEVNTIIAAVMKQKSNNAKIPHMIAGYFNDLDALFKKLPSILAPKANIAFVVANCRWNGVVVPVDHLICRIAEQYGFVAKKIMIARMKGNSPQQMSEYGRIPVRESIVILQNK